MAVTRRPAISAVTLNSNESSQVDYSHSLGFNTYKVAASFFSTRVHLLMYKPYANVKRLRFRIPDLCSSHISST
jgi:hypothetical protein